MRIVRRRHTMKVFRFIHVILMLALAIGLPIAAVTRGPNDDFSISRAFGHAGIAAAVIIILLVLNFALARLCARISANKRRV